MDKIPNSKRKQARKKKITRGKLVKMLDNVFSQFYRKSQSDKRGICECYTCGKRDHWKKMQCGHFVSRGVYALRWSLENVRVQCFRFNCMLSGNYIEYTRKMIDEVGIEKVDELRAMKNVIVKITTDEIEEQIDKYKSLLG